MYFLDSIVVSISACHAEDPGSIPGRGVNFFPPFPITYPLQYNFFYPYLSPSLCYFLFLVAHVRDTEFCSFINHYVSYSGFTPLHYAILCDDVKLVRYLLDQGADPTLENNRGYIPSDYCTNEEIKALLEEGAIKVC